MVLTCSSTPRGSISTPVLEFTNEIVQLSNGYAYHDSPPSLIGLGSFGVVYKGFSTHDNQKVAIKKMSKINVKENELRVIRSLNSSYLVGVLDICMLDDVTCCLVMELCDGDLEYHMKNNSNDGRLNSVNLRVLMDNIARGYKGLYDLKIVHRDIKPQNILIKYVGKTKQLLSAKITDFGIARTLESEGSDLCNVAGTLFYMAPEVGANLLKTCQYDFKVDMWSIGCLLYQCITGEIPFDECCLCKLFLYTAGANYDAYDPPPLPETTNEEICDIIHSLLEIDSSRRCTPVQFYDKATSFNCSQPYISALHLVAHKAPFCHKSNKCYDRYYARIKEHQQTVVHYVPYDSDAMWMRSTIRDVVGLSEQVNGVLFNRKCSV